MDLLNNGGNPGLPGHPVGQNTWPEPPRPPPRKQVFPILANVLVIILVIGWLAAAFAISVLLPFRTPVSVVPSVKLGPVGYSLGMQPLDVSSVSTAGERTLDPGDRFRITGNNTSLPATASFTFYLL